LDEHNWCHSAWHIWWAVHINELFIWENKSNISLSERSIFRFLDPNAGPLSELERWKRRLRLLTSITEQLKSKECKAVIGVLITAKSRLLKHWKSVDSGWDEQLPSCELYTHHLL
jgi:hypothetical protein